MIETTNHHQKTSCWDYDLRKLGNLLLYPNPRGRGILVDLSIDHWEGRRELCRDVLRRWRNGHKSRGYDVGGRRSRSRRS